MSQTTANAPRPHWYQHRWPWVLMSIPFAAVLFGIFMVVTALRYPDDVVADTYYRDGQGINQLRALDEMAHTLGLSASLIGSAENGRSQLLFNGGEEAVLQLFLYHVTDSSADRRFLFSPKATDEGVCEARVSARVSTRAKMTRSPRCWQSVASGIWSCAANKTTGVCASAWKPPSRGWSSDAGQGQTLLLLPLPLAHAGSHRLDS